MSATIAVAGNINADISYTLSRPPRPGETLLAAGFSLGPGGKAGNASVALARLGAAPRLLGSVGADALGALVLAALEREGVATDRVVHTGRALTGVATVLVAPGAENAIVTHLGANLELTTADLPGMARGARSALSGCDALLMTLGLPQPALLALAGEARALGLTLVLDATPLRGDPLPRELLAVDLLSANRVEAEQLTGATIDLDDETAIACACADLCALGANAAVLKLGAAGAAWAQGSERGRVAAPVIEAVDPTGAGDAFMAGLTLGLAQSESLPEAVEFACLLGALSATGRGAQGGWATLADVDRFAAAVASTSTRPRLSPVPEGAR
jgi:ribokinase